MRDIDPVTISWGRIEEADPIVMSELNRPETVSVCRRSPWRGFIYSLIPPSHQLLHLHVQRRCQGDEGTQPRVHWGAGAGLALLELLVGVGGDAGGVG